MSSEKIVKTALIALSQNPRLINQFTGAMPNIEMQTMGGDVWWNDLGNFKGWRIQKNKIFGNCRLLDSNNLRKAWWVNEDSMIGTFNKLLKYKRYPQAKEQSQKSWQEDNEDSYESVNYRYEDRSVDASASDWSDYIEYHSGR